MAINTKTISKWTAVLLTGLLIIYYVITLVNTNRITEQINMIGKHPYPIAIEVGDVTTYIARLDGLAERLTYIRTRDAVEGVKRDNEDIDKEISESLDFITEWYIYRPEDAPVLQQTYLELKDVQNRLLAQCMDPDFTDEAARVFYKEEITPRTGEMNRLAESMTFGSQSKFAEFEEMAQNARIHTIVFSTVLTLAVFIALYIYLYILKKKRQQEEQLQLNLREALESAQNANMAKSQFLFNMSHDIRTPMNAVIGMTAIAALHADEPDKVRDCLGKITASSKHLLSLINDVLDMSKIESGKLSLNSEDFTLSEFVHEFLTIVEPQAKSKHLDFEVSVCGVEHEHVTGDTLRIRQALLNITGNALKFTPAGGKITVKIRELPSQFKNYGTYQFTVSDTGIGMPEEFITKIFDPFERAHSSTNSKTEGTGLGMSITKNIVDMMNGQITVQSDEGKGTNFHVTLHLKLQPVEEESFDFSALRELRALVVDDDRDVCENTAKILDELGMRSEWVLTGAEAVEKAVVAHRANQEYHSVILDWRMPGMDGLETARRIRSQVGSQVPIIILTAYDWTEIEEEARQAGINAFLAKPLFKSSLYRVMRGLVDGGLLHEKEEPREPEADMFDGRVLLVEDNLINMEIARELIEHCGCRVETAEDGIEALRKVTAAENGYYGLIFMDIQMPNMDGYEATRRIRLLEKEKNRERMPIVAMSANAFVEDIEKAYDSGMDGYITKPVDIKEIQKTLKTQLDRRAQHR